jgi:hypothetical protein
MLVMHGQTQMKLPLPPTKKNVALYEMMWRNMVERATDDNMAHAYCMFCA